LIEACPPHIPPDVGFFFVCNMSEGFAEKPSPEALDENTFKELLESKQYRALRGRLLSEAEALLHAGKRRLI